MLIPGEDTLTLIFTLIFLVGGIITLIPGFSVKGKREGFYPSAMLMFGGLALLIDAENLVITSYSIHYTKLYEIKIHIVLCRMHNLNCL